MCALYIRYLSCWFKSQPLHARMHDILFFGLSTAHWLTVKVWCTWNSFLIFNLHRIDIMSYQAGRKSAAEENWNKETDHFWSHQIHSVAFIAKQPFSIMADVRNTLNFASAVSVKNKRNLPRCQLILLAPLETTIFIFFWKSRGYSQKLIFRIFLIFPMESFHTKNLLFANQF